MAEVSLESVAKVLLINENQEVLVLNIGDYKDKPERSFTPDLPGGTVDPGESELIAVKRELFEETGIVLELDAFKLAYAKTQFYASEHKSVSKFLYIAHITYTPNVTISWEHSDHDWTPLKDITKNTQFRPFFEEAINYSFAAGIL